MTERAPLADMDADTFFCELLPRLNSVLAQPLLIKEFVVQLQRPRGLRIGIGAAHPIGLVMTDLHRVVTTRALRNAQLGQAMDRVTPPTKAISYDQPLWIFCTDSLDQALDHANIDFLGDVGRLVQQIETEPVVWDSLVSPR